MSVQLGENILKMLNTVNNTYTASDYIYISLDNEMWSYEAIRIGASDEQYYWVLKFPSDAIVTDVLSSSGFELNVLKITVIHPEPCFKVCFKERTDCLIRVLYPTMLDKKLCKYKHNVTVKISFSKKPPYEEYDPGDPYKKTECILYFDVYTLGSDKLKSIRDIKLLPCVFVKGYILFCNSRDAQEHELYFRRTIFDIDFKDNVNLILHTFMEGAEDNFGSDHKLYMCADYNYTIKLDSSVSIEIDDTVINLR